MIIFDDERLKEIEKSEYDRMNMTRMNNPWEEVSGQFDIDIDSDDDEIRGFVFGKIMSVFDHCYTTEPRSIHIRGYIKFDIKVLKELLKEIDPYIDSAAISFRDHDVTQHEITFIKYNKDDRWHYKESLILFGERKFLFENNDNE